VGDRVGGRIDDDGSDGRRLGSGGGGKKIDAPREEEDKGERKKAGENEKKLFVGKNECRDNRKKFKARKEVFWLKGKN